MSEAWLIVSAFWIWWWVDAVRWYRRPRIVVRPHAPFGFGVTNEAFHLRSLAPWSWSFEPDAAGITVSPEGICNFLTASPVRPSPVPETAKAWLWDDIKTVSEHGAWIHVNRQPFMRKERGFRAADLVRWIQEFQRTKPKDRVALAARFQAERFSPFHARRAIRVFRKRTRSLGVTATLACASWFAVTIFALPLLGATDDLLPDGWAGRAFRYSAGAAVYFHIVSVWLAYSAHRRFHPKATEERVTLVLNVLLLPAQAIRLRSQLAKGLGKGRHPLVWMEASLRPSVFKILAQDALLDLKFPVAERPAVGAATAIREAAVPLEAKHLTPLLKNTPISIKDLERAPEPDSQRSCLYCPRCHSQFEHADARCPNGIALKPIPAATQCPS